MAKINENNLAKAVAKREGGAKNLSIGQIKEVQKLVLDTLNDMVSEGSAKMSDVIALIEKHG